MKKIALPKLISLVVLLVSLICIALYSTTLAKETKSDSKFTYYYNQLTTSEARGIYNTLSEMLEKDKLKEGTYSVDLIKSKVFANKHYSKDSIMADFISARDAFMLDNSDIFYVDFDKLSITQTELSSNNYSIMLGIGREDNYLRDGFDKNNVEAAITDFNTEVEEIVEIASTKTNLDEKIYAAYKEILDRVSYALESDAEKENVLYVRTPYGALVRGQTVCEGYARALKAVLDEMDIDNILVQGMFVDSEKLEPHMWNYVKMDDNRWYLLDATMEDGSNDGNKFFLKNGQDDILKYYQPDGVISLSSISFEFTYPNLSGKSYERLATEFTAEESGDYNVVSYKGLGIEETEDLGKYILCSFNGNDWYYYKNYLIVTRYLQSHGFSEVLDNDFNGYYIDYVKFAYYSITDTAPDRTFDTTAPLEYFAFDSEIYEMYDISKVSEAINYVKAAPVVLSREPNNYRLEGGKTYDIKLTFTEELKLANIANNPDIKWLNPIEGASYSNFFWDGNKIITFKLHTAKNYNFVTNYYFELVNLIGKESSLKPYEFSFSTVNNPSFGCPKIQSSLNTAYANTPALIADSNLADNEWKDENGNSISKDLPNRLSLVATKISDTTKENMLDKIESSTNNEVLSAQTFDISLGLCNQQIAYVTGRKIKVFVPFPSGYDAESNVSFKAYHFDKDGNPEEIDCVTTDFGIIIMCDKFSPFAVIATNNVSTEKKVITYANGNGSFDKEIVTLHEGTNTTFTITPNEGYIIEEIYLNGNKLETSTSVTLKYEDLLADGNILEASFVLKPTTTEEDDDEESTTPPSSNTGSSSSSSTTYRPIINANGGKVTISPKNPERGEKVTITITPNSNMEIDNISIVDRYKKEVNYRNVNGKYTFTQPRGKVTITVTFKQNNCEGGNGTQCPSYKFDDLDLDAWYHKYVDYVLKNNIMNGTSSSTFEPNSTLTRAMLVTTIWRLEGSPVVNYLIPFNDVESETWYTEAIRWATSEKIVGGNGNGTFTPNTPVTREQLAVILYRYIQKKDLGFKGLWAFNLDYSDTKDMSEWAYEAFCWMTMNEIITDYDNKLLPKEFAIRADIAQTLTLLMEIISK